MLHTLQEKYRKVFRKWWIRQRVKELFLDKIFGLQNSDKKLCGLVDCSSEEEFDQKLSTLESVWNAREDNVSEKSFHKWFVTEKVNILQV